jgi:hypothetical protein
MAEFFFPHIGALFENDDPKTCSRQFFGHDPTRGSGSDYEEVDLSGAFESRPLPVHAALLLEMATMAESCHGLHETFRCFVQSI